MRYRFLWVLFCVCTITAKANSSVSGKLTGFELTLNTVVTINQYNGFNYTLYDTTLASANGAFAFIKKIPEGFFQLSIVSQGIAEVFYADGKTDVQINIENNEFQTERFHFADVENTALTELLNASKQLEIALNTINEDFNSAQLDSFYVQKLPVHNGKVQDAYREFNRKLTDIKTKYPNTTVSQIFSSIYQLPLFDEDKLNSSKYDNQDAYMRDHFFDLWKLDDARITSLPEVKNKVEKYFRFFSKKKHEWLIKKCDELLNKPKSEKVKTYLASLLMDFFTKVKENDVVVHIVENNLHGCLEGIDLNLINFTQNNLRGTKVMELELPAENMQAVKLSDVYSKSKVTVLYFWSPDCFHCRNFHPVIKNLKAKYGKELAVYDVCMEDDATKWRGAVNEFALNFNNVVAADEDRKRIKQMFGINYTPMIFVIGAGGEILDKDLYIDNIGESLDKFLR